MKHRSNTLLRIATPLKSFMQRFMYVGLIVLSFCLMLVGKIDAVLIDNFRIQLTNTAAPLLEAVSRPISAISRQVSNMQDLINIRDENLRLAQENTRLKRWLTAARKLKSENLTLQALLHSIDDRKQKFVTARVIAGTSGVYSSVFIVNTGRYDGVKKGQAVLSDKGLVGRVSSVGGHSARIILATDINSRIPVILEATRTRAIMVGNNTLHPELIHLPPGAHVTNSDRVVTSGHGGAFPPGLPVGIVTAVTDHGIKLRLFTNFHQLEFVRVVDFGIDGVIYNSKTGKEINEKATKNNERP